MSKHIGMLWLAYVGRMTPVEQVKQAAASYRRQYGVSPSLCLVDKALFGELNNLEEFEGLRLESSDSLLPNYIWIGMGE